jgi:hypothetical protein
MNADQRPIPRCSRRVPAARAAERRRSTTMVRLVALAVLPWALTKAMAASAESSKALRSEEHPVERIEVQGPLAVGFFPKIAQVELDADEGARSALEHLGYAVEEMSKCLRPRGISVQAVQTELLIFQNGASRTELSLRDASNEIVGCYLVAPRREPKIIRATAGPSSLVILCPAAASLYFGVPECCPDGFECCRDGRVVDAAYECDD